MLRTYVREGKVRVSSINVKDKKTKIISIKKNVKAETGAPVNIYLII
jgi:hypothetical protein